MTIKRKDINSVCAKYGLGVYDTDIVTDAIEDILHNVPAQTFSRPQKRAVNEILEMIPDVKTRQKTDDLGFTTYKIL